MRLLMLIALSLALLCSVALAAPSYDELCERIVRYAQLASKAHNEGRKEDAERASSEVEKAYAAAVAVDPNNPQAALHLGVFYTNSNRFDEAEEKLSDVLTKLTSPKDAQSRSAVQMSLRRARYGRVSQLRDRAYDGGKGNLTLAHVYALQQLQHTQQPQVTNHEVATLELMLCENDPAMCESAAKRFTIAQTSAGQHFSRFRSSFFSGSQALQCIRGPVYVGKWGPHPNVTEHLPIPGVGDLFAYDLRTKHAVLGRDGIVALRGGSDCAIFSPNSDSLTSVADNILTDAGRSVSDPSSQYFNADGVTTPVFSLIQFSSAAFYHWMCECLPRLIVGMKQWGPANLGKLLIPKLSASNRFIMDSLQLLGVPEAGIEAVEYLGMHTGSHLRHVAWASAMKIGPSGISNTQGYSLAHPEALRLARDAIVAALQQSPFPKRESATGKILIASRGKSTTMRHFDEPALIASLQKAFPSVGVLTFDGGAPLAENLALFREAAVIVGAHGGALSNIMACSRGSKLVEIGFRTLGARHYEHVAKALNVDYQLVPVHPDPLGRAMGAPSISFDHDAVIDAVRRALGPLATAPGDEL